jgi:O-methyltransferase involved in polyketide biosynthesis
LNVQADRRRVLEATQAQSRRVLLLTEGLLFYLPAETVGALAAETLGCSLWILDISPPISLLLASGGDSLRQANELRHQTRLEGKEILEVIRNSGWTAAASKTFMKDGAPFAIQRMAKNGWTPDANTARPSPDDPGGVWLFKSMPIRGEGQP